ncbi:toll-like receptor 2 [Scomber japonicus]|uniref:toll-like receptor 2 n=1 Tax=Scomber japonicus TaxID=13676 RepID=UPI002305BBCA|nr:toll-like receptor 2 [Scomber japonicus]
MRTVVFLMFVLLSMTDSVSRPQCHSCERTSCKCSRQNLTKVPAVPSHVTTELDLSFNRLGKITSDDFIAYTSLRCLIISNNRIRVIEEPAFDPLTNLEKLDLSSNRLDSLSVGWFKNLVSLQYLNLVGNMYKTLGQGNLFQSLKKLKFLHIGGPHLQSVRKSDFSGLSKLEELFFDGEKLQVYAEGSLRQIGHISHVTLGLNGPFMTNPALVKVILTDVAHPNTTLTFTDTKFYKEDQMSPIHVVSDSGTKSLILKNSTMSITASVTLLKMLSQSDITMLAIEDTKIEYIIFGPPTFLPKVDHLEVIIFKNIDIPQYYNFPVLPLLKPLLERVQRLSLINSKLFAIPCLLSVNVVDLEFFDITDNMITDLVLREMLCDGKFDHFNLQTINISRNNLHSINSQLFTKLHNLKNIDMSGNMFYTMPETCNWPPNLQYLNLSSMHLGIVTSCLPTSLRIIDLSYNDLKAFNIELPLLTDLYISGNKMYSFPDGDLYPRLSFLSIQNNYLNAFSKNDIEKYKMLKNLEAGMNMYDCSCDFLAFMTSDMKNYRVTFGDELKSYICHSPDAARGKTIADARLSVFECHTALALSLLCLGILAVFLLFAGLCHRFNVMWYMKMTWAWLKAKKKPKLKKEELEYDAFVSYSEMDSGWVEAHLIPELEQSEPPVRLCLHKRDFVPGGWILDNIMNAIEKSHKTLFIISKHFVRSEWCKYELDYTHFRLFDRNIDTAVLILLEPIDKETIPKKFCKLRRVMNSRTYLEWPDEDNQIPRFWQSLRAAIRRPVDIIRFNVDE